MPPIPSEQRADTRDACQSLRLTVDEAADYIRLSVPTLNRLRGSGGGPAYLKLGARRVAYDTRDLDAWLTSCRRSSTTEAA